MVFKIANSAFNDLFARRTELRVLFNFFVSAQISTFKQKVRDGVILVQGGYSVDVPAPQLCTPLLPKTRWQKGQAYNLTQDGLQTGTFLSSTSRT